MTHKAGCKALNSLQNYSEYFSSFDFDLSHYVSSYIQLQHHTLMGCSLVGILETWQASYLPERKTNDYKIVQKAKENIQGPRVDANPMP